MEVKIAKLDSANLVINGLITAEDISSGIEKIVKQLSKTANLPGFRKGKVPASAVKKYYGSRLTEDSEAEALRNLLDKGLAETGIKNSDLISEPDIVNFKRIDGGHIEVSVQVYLKPVIQDININSLIDAINIPEATTEETDKELSRLLNKIANFTTVERKAENGDRVNLDFSGSINGVVFDGGTATGFDLILGSGSFIDGFESQLIGSSAGDNIDVSVTFPENYSPDLSGKNAIFKCKINRIEEAEKLVLNNETAEKIINDSYSKLRAKTPNIDSVEFVKREISNSLFIKNKLAKFDELKISIREKLLTSVSFDVPRAILEQELENRVNNSARNMTAEEIETVKNSPEKLEELRNKFMPEALTAVKLTFIVDKISKENKVHVDDKEVEESLKYQFIMSGQDPDLMLQTYKERGILPLVKMSILEDRVLEFIIDSKIKRS